jgi:hypothetical protein
MSEWPEVARKAQDLFLDEGADLALLRGFCGPKPLTKPAPVLLARTGKTSTKNELRPTVHSLARLVKGEIVVPWLFESGFTDRLPGSIHVRVCGSH